MHKVTILGPSLALVLLLTMRAPAAERGDIWCATAKRYYTQPKECLLGCRSGGLGNFLTCVLAPQCPGFDAKDEKLRRFYNQAVLKRILPREVLIAHLINQYMQPFNTRNFTISFSDEKAFWARISEVEGPNSGPFPLEMANDALDLSPAYLTTALGHEMIHAEQFNRPYDADTFGIGSAIKALRELEAHSWESGKDATPHKIPPNRFLDCVSTEERQEMELNYTCASWTAEKIVSDVFSSPRRNVFAPKLQRWMTADPFAKYWIGKQKDLAADPGQIPGRCRTAKRRFDD